MNHGQDGARMCTAACAKFLGLGWRRGSHGTFPLCSPLSARAASQPSHVKSFCAGHAGGSELARVPPLPV
eukprot:7309744-Alexandrium_andersonii.AAC.1